MHAIYLGITGPIRGDGRLFQCQHGKHREYDERRVFAVKCRRRCDWTGRIRYCESRADGRCHEIDAVSEYFASYTTKQVELWLANVTLHAALQRAVHWGSKINASSSLTWYGVMPVSCTIARYRDSLHDMNTRLMSVNGLIHVASKKHIIFHKDSKVYSIIIARVHAVNSSCTRADDNKNHTGKQNFISPVDEALIPTLPITCPAGADFNKWNW